METILVDNIDRLHQIPGDGGKVWVKVEEEDSALTLATRVNEIISQSDDVVIFTNLNFWNHRLMATMNPGLTLLEFIRFAADFDGKVNLARRAHCVIYSDYSFETFLRQYPENHILFSPGTTFLQITSGPFNVNLQKIRTDRFDPLRWFYTLRKVAQIDTDNHSLANWWGVHKLAEVHRVVTKSEYQPGELTSRLQDLDNLKAVGLYSPSENTHETAALKMDQIKSINKLRRRVSERKINLLHIDDEWENGWSKIIANILFHTDEEIKEHDFTDYRDLRSSSSSSVRTLVTFPEYKADQPERFVNELFESVCKWVDAFKPTCLMLDLRLAGTQENKIPIETTSGVRLLQLLRDSYKGIPVIMTTASNKAWSIEKLLQQGVDAYWIKERPDINSDFGDSVTNYRRLLELVEKVSGDKYRFLEQFARGVKQHCSEPNPWYAAPYWSRGEAEILGDTEIEIIRRILNETVSLLRSYLHSSVMRYEYRVERDEKHLVANLITYAFHAVELIHNPQNDGRVELSGSMVRRNDNLGNRLRQIRNDYAHLEFLFADPNKIGTFDWLRRFLIGLLAYLNISPQGCSEMLSKDQILSFRHYQDTITEFRKLDGRCG